VCEAFAPSVLFTNELKGAKTYAKALGIDAHTVLEDIYGEGIKRLISKTARPPKLGVADLAFFVCGKIITLAVGGKHADGNGSVRIGFNHGGNVDLAVYVVLLDLEIGDACRVLGKKRHTSPNTHIGKEGTPIPTEHAMSLTDIAEARKSLNCLHKLEIAALLLYVGMYVSACNGKLVFSVYKVICNVKLVGDVHIVKVCEVMSVEVDIRKGIDALEAKKIGVLALFKIKGAAEGIIVMGKSEALKLIIAVIRIFHQACIKQE
jgi:hypothetical protein